MKVQESPAGVFTEVNNDTAMITVSTSSGPVNWPGQIVSTWNQEALENIGIFEAVPLEVPEGYMITNPSFAREDDGTIHQLGDLIPIP